VEAGAAVGDDAGASTEVRGGWLAHPGSNSSAARKLGIRAAPLPDSKFVGRFIGDSNRQLELHPGWRLSRLQPALAPGEQTIVPLHGAESRVNTPREKMNLPPYLKPQGDGILLAVKLQPRASSNEIGGPMGSELKIKVTAPPVESAANEALLRFLAETLDCARNQIELLRGHTSRHKTIKIRGVSVAEVLQRLTGG
jgi:uncharacterized protein